MIPASIPASIDGHVVEPRNMFNNHMFNNHVPKKYAECDPELVVDDKGIDRWIYRDRPALPASTRSSPDRPRNGATIPPATRRCAPPATTSTTGFAIRMSTASSPPCVFPLHRIQCRSSELRRYGRDHRRHDLRPQRPAYRGVGGCFPGRLIPIAILPLCNRGSRSRKSNESPPRAATRSPCQNCRISMVCPAITTSTTGARCSRRSAMTSHSCHKTRYRKVAATVSFMSPGNRPDPPPGASPHRLPVNRDVYRGDWRRSGVGRPC